jgi:hypothetical protein
LPSFRSIDGDQFVALTLPADINPDHPEILKAVSPGTFQVPADNGLPVFILSEVILCATGESLCADMHSRQKADHPCLVFVFVAW